MSDSEVSIKIKISKRQAKSIYRQVKRIQKNPYPGDDSSFEADDDLDFLSKEKSEGQELKENASSFDIEHRRIEPDNKNENGNLGRHILYASYHTIGILINLSGKSDSSIFILCFCRKKPSGTKSH